MNKSSTEWTQQIAADLFLVKQKLTDEEYLQILRHMQGLYGSIEKSNETKKQLYKSLQDLKRKYIDLAHTFQVFYRNVNAPDYDEGDNETYMVVD